MREMDEGEARGDVAENFACVILGTQYPWGSSFPAERSSTRV